MLAINLYHHRSLPCVRWDFICYCLLFLACAVYALSCQYILHFVCFYLRFLCVINVQQFRHFLRFRNSSAWRPHNTGEKLSGRTPLGMLTALPQTFSRHGASCPLPKNPTSADTLARLFLFCGFVARDTLTYLVYHRDMSCWPKSFVWQHAVFARAP